MRPPISLVLLLFPMQSRELSRKHAEGPERSGTQHEDRASHSASEMLWAYPLAGTEALAAIYAYSFWRLTVPPHFISLPNTMVLRWVLGVDHFQTWFAYLANGAKPGVGVD